MQKCKAFKTPLATSSRLSVHDGEPLTNEESTEYRSLVGGLQYVTLTRSDISYVVNKVYQFLHAPTQLHMAAVKRILRYLQGNLKIGLKFHKQSSLKPSAFLDAD
jgi:hypothetical protein